MDKVRFFDTTLRDGEQAPGYSMNIEEKVRMARQLEALGIDVIEAGFAIASQGDFASVEAIAGAVSSPVVASLSRALVKDIDAAWAAVKGASRPRIHTFLATSDLHLACKLKMTREQALARIAEAVKYARNLCGDVEFSLEDASRTDRDYMCRVVETAIAAGASTVNLPDTVGYSTPYEVAAMVSNCEFRTFLTNEEVHGGEYYLWNYTPNPNQNGAQFIQQLVKTLLIDGEVLICDINGSLYIADSYEISDELTTGVKFTNVSFKTQSGATVTFRKRFQMKDVLFIRLDNQEIASMLEDIQAGYDKLLSLAMNKYKRSEGRKGVLKRNRTASGDEKAKEKEQ